MLSIFNTITAHLSYRNGQSTCPCDGWGVPLRLDCGSRDDHFGLRRATVRLTFVSSLDHKNLTLSWLPRSTRICLGTDFLRLAR